jgi:cation transporter-like permease
MFNSVNSKDNKKNGYYYPFFNVFSFACYYFLAGVVAGVSVVGATVVSTGATAAVVSTVIVESTGAASVLGLQPKAITLPSNITTIKAIKAIFFKLM